LYPKHAEGLNKWKALPGNSTTGGVIVANISEPISLRDCRAIPWDRGVDMI
jgi:hypothetical protein